jgi:hypothetical protein
MSRKNRAFALAVATAALVGISAPVAHAASGPSGFNNDSLVNASGNQIPLQACNNDIPINVGAIAGQIPLGGLSGALGLLNTGAVTSSVTRDCTQTPTQTNTATTTTGNVNTAAAPGPMGGPMSHGPNSGPSGFNNDSLVNASGNQLPVQVCNNDIPVNGGLLGAVQVPVDGASGALGLLNTGPVSSMVSRNCTQTPGQTNTSTTTTGNVNNG